MQAELSLGNQVRELPEPEPYATFGRGEWHCLRGNEGGGGPKEEPKSLKDPTSVTSPFPGPTSHHFDSESKNTSRHHCKGLHLLISITVSWTEGPELGQVSGWQGAPSWASGHCTSQINPKISQTLQGKIKIAVILCSASHLWHSRLLCDCLCLLCPVLGREGRPGYFSHEKQAKQKALSKPTHPPLKIHVCHGIS